MTAPVVENEPIENTGASDTDNMTKEDASAGSVQDSRLFIKKSPIWEEIETLKVFQTLPQNPHFRPLSECPEDFREGVAVGLMVTFANLVEKIDSLKLEDPRSICVSLLESLGDLEEHGFDVVSVKDRVNKLLLQFPVAQWWPPSATTLDGADRELFEKVRGFVEMILAQRKDKLDLINDRELFEKVLGFVETILRERKDRLDPVIDLNYPPPNSD